MDKKDQVYVTDEQLIQFYGAGDNTSLGVLYNRYYKKVFNKCLSFLKTPEEAFDAAQDVLLKSFEKIDLFKGKSSFSTWLYSITNNHCLELLRKKNRVHHIDVDDTWDIIDQEYDEEEIEQKERDLNSIRAFVEKLPISDRDLVVFRYEKNYSIKDLQAYFGLTASAVKMRLKRARKKLELLFLESRASA